MRSQAINHQSIHPHPPEINQRLRCIIFIIFFIIDPGFRLVSSLFVAPPCFVFALVHASA
jgi:hypothetical protein